jgi:hypothetical protein
MHNSLSLMTNPDIWKSPSLVSNDMNNE